MHNYINPIELLNLNTNISSGINSTTIRRKKKHLLAEIELSDTDTVIHNGIELTKSDCLKAIDDLDNKDKKDFHLFIYQNNDLNNFLTIGDITFFKTYKAESLYKLNEFIDFISPYFSNQYAKTLSKNFKTKNFDNVKYLLSIKPIVSEVNFEYCYKSTYSILKEIEIEIIKITEDIEFKKSKHIENDFGTLPTIINRKVNVDLINLLPAYFQRLRNQFAQSIMNLARDINNDPYQKYKPAFEIIEIANAIQIDGLVKQTISKGYYTIKKNYEDSIPETINKQSTLLKLAPIEIEDEDEAEDEENEENELVQPEKENKESINIAYWLFLTTANAIGFFYIPVQKIILGLSLLIVLISLIAFRKDNDFSIGSFFKRNIIFIIAASLGFFYSIIAQILVSYYFLAYLNLLFDVITKKEKKSRFEVWHYTAGAIIITFLYYNYFFDVKLFSANPTEIVEQKLTDKDYFKKGNTLFHQSNFNAAIIEFDNAINLNPNYIDAYGDRGASRANLGQYEAAILDYQKAEQLGMKSSILYSNWGYAYYRLKQPDTALTFLEKAIKIDPNNGNVYRWRGEIKYDKNDNKGTEVDYTKAITSNLNAS